MAVLNSHLKSNVPKINGSSTKGPLPRPWFCVRARKIATTKLRGFEEENYFSNKIYATKHAAVAHIKCNMIKTVFQIEESKKT